MPKERQHGNKVVKALLKQISGLGFDIIQRRNGFQIRPPAGISGPVYFTHGTPKAVKAIKSDFKKLYDVTLD
ncbi:MAG: hypothetical protein ACO4AZ_01585 [Ilumatobacteraceae bacterium]